MNPYYEHGGVTIYHGDCREVLPTLVESSVDAMITDPPFFMPATHYQSRVEWQRAWSDTSVLAAFWSVILDAMVRVLKPSGHCIAFCNGDSYPVFYPEMYRRFDFLKCMVWDKGHVGLGRVWRNQHDCSSRAAGPTRFSWRTGRSAPTSCAIRRRHRSIEITPWRSQPRCFAVG
jgi:DNA modification methylase